MLKNYLLLALKVLRRKPFYTFVSLFGISFTLMILMLLTSMFNGMLGANTPQSERDRMVFLPSLKRMHYKRDTIPVIDTIVMDDGTTRTDTTYSKTGETDGTSNNSIDYRFLDQHMRNIEGVEHYTFFSDAAFIDGYIDGRKFSFNTGYTDANYWKVFDFEFVEGGPYLVDDVEAGELVVIMTEPAARNYFGKKDGTVYVGREAILGDQHYRVKGIVKRPLSDNDYVRSDIWMPLTTSPDPKLLNNGSLAGFFTAIYLAEQPSKREQIKEQITFLAENFEMPPEENYFEAIELRGYTFTEFFAAGITGTEDGRQAQRLLFIPIIVLLSLFVALPLVNLINLNISRVFERQSEIGVRKAFGAEPKDILYQFMFENLVLTLIGGTIGLSLAVLLIRTINKQELLGSLQLGLTPQVFLYFIAVILLFGLLSGLLPAYRMSKTNVATTLR